MARARLALTLLILRENLRGIVITSLVVGVCILAIGALIARRSSPIIDVESTTGTVVNVLNVPPSPEAWIGRGFRYQYGIRLKENDLLVFVYGDAAMPRAIGSEVALERRYRRNGTETYQLLDE
ncbi:MAG: hypothetical protein E5V72_13720 [Mesorhizobium sp.]|uniref:hypothetical protein n=1 Tax=Mesorhizobium sp. TaxID=1871066 RepID=UPI000FE9E68E|nr:hypothetical protein [Mesorhizobium sp.]RWC45699.1 MAG: hypothetical protein EOS28_07245 [Mesorhizobium sp.]RWD39716.1 MAG: hypothetical protein EOS59_32125 [Mesorhizobium sp.]RWE55913.1 MAG: hypothetical protein EOS24_22785 [Mesorhizobium sp.]RWF02084.1 MAG: hypothetical protein EOS68_06630 [Mesorhizobium sp.]RWF07294.1 MAG: hypothetical protein EOS69_29365 [Mesorhizobium sp.]